MTRKGKNQLEGPEGDGLDAVDRDSKGMLKCKACIRSAEDTDARRRRIV